MPKPEHDVMTMPEGNSDPVYCVQPCGVVLPSLPRMQAPPFEDCGTEVAVHGPVAPLLLPELLVEPPLLEPVLPLLVVEPLELLPLEVLPVPPSSPLPLAPELEVLAPPSPLEPPSPLLLLLLEHAKAATTSATDPNDKVAMRLMEPMLRTIRCTGLHPGYSVPQLHVPVAIAHVGCAMGHWLLMVHSTQAPVKPKPAPMRQYGVAVGQSLSMAHATQMWAREQTCAVAEVQSAFVLHWTQVDVATSQWGAVAPHWASPVQPARQRKVPESHTG